MLSRIQKNKYKNKIGYRPGEHKLTLKKQMCITGGIIKIVYILASE